MTNVQMFFRLWASCVHTIHKRTTTPFLHLTKKIGVAQPSSWCVSPVRFSQVLLSLAMVPLVMAGRASGFEGLVDTSKAVAAGALCPSESFALDAIANRLKITFQGRAALERTGPQAFRSTCVVRVPFEVPLGFTISKLTFRSEALLEKETGSTVDLTMTVSAFGIPLGSAQRSFALDETYSGFANVYKKVHLIRGERDRWADRLCNSARTEKTLLGVNLAASAQGNTAAPIETRLSLPAKETAVDVWIELEPCL